MTLTTGQILQDRYRIVALLGQGGMGAVYRAWDTRLGVAVAIKEMTPDPAMDTAHLLEAREQFHREASVLSRLSHPHLVRVSDFFDENGNTYLVMAFVDGESLASVIKRSGSVPEAQVLAWADQLLGALQYCHQEGVLHRDIKPQNVIVQPDGNVVLVDFGLVKLWNPEDPRTQTIIRSMGTPQYAPPEQYEPHLGHTDPRSDLYSLGATLYHALTGQVPPTATTRIVNPGMLVPVRQFNPGVSARVERALERAMALRSDERFQSAQEMRLNLFNAPDMRSRTVRAPEVPEVNTSASKRTFPFGVAGGIAVALLICAIVAGAAIGITYWLSNRSDQAAQQNVPTATMTVSASPTTPEASTPTFMPVDVVSESTEMPTPSPTSTSMPQDTATPQPTETPTPVPTSTLQPTSTPIPTPSESPTPTCPEVTGPFAAIWQTHRDELGCAQGDVYDSWAAQEHFEGGMMTWREDNDRIYAHYDNGSWASYANTWSEGDPDYTCGTPQNPPTPIRGFGKTWCTYDAVRNGLGNATGPEVGQTIQLQTFEDGFILQSQAGDTYVFLNSGRWWVN